MAVYTRVIMQTEHEIDAQILHNEATSLRDRTRMYIFTGSLAVSSAMYGLCQVDVMPRSEHNLTDIYEHAAHIAPGIALGYGFKAAAERLPARLRQYATAVSIAGVGIVATLFETQISDILWYRNTTKDPVDALYTVIAGAVGAYCLKTKNNDPV